MIGNKAVHLILIRIRILDPHWKKWIRILDLRWKKNPDSGSALEKNGFGFWICTGKRIRILDLHWKNGSGFRSWRIFKKCQIIFLFFSLIFIQKLDEPIQIWVFRVKMCFCFYFSPWIRICGFHLGNFLKIYQKSRAFTGLKSNVNFG